MNDTSTAITDTESTPLWITIVMGFLASIVAVMIIGTFIFILINAVFTLYQYVFRKANNKDMDVENGEDIHSGMDDEGVVP